MYIFLAGGKDYIPVNRTITFNHSKKSEEVVVLTQFDDDLEQAEFFSIALTLDRDESNVLLFPARSMISINDFNSMLAENA